MRVIRAAPEIIMWVLIIGVALMNVAIYTGVVRGEDAIDVRAVGSDGRPLLSTTPAADSSAARAIRAEEDSGEHLPGRWVPTQGRRHVQGYGAGPRVPFCSEGEVHAECYASNPPSSGLHFPVQRDVRLADGNIVNIPPDPGIYDFEIPREAIPHLQEHAGVYVGFNCASDACRVAVNDLGNLVAQLLEIDTRVVMSPAPDLPLDTIGLAAWTRVDTMSAAEYSNARARAFIETHSCRFDPEGFCGD
jgi:hypothetical protein